MQHSDKQTYNVRYKNKKTAIKTNGLHWKLTD